MKKGVFFLFFLRIGTMLFCLEDFHLVFNLGDSSAELYVENENMTVITGDLISNYKVNNECIYDDSLNVGYIREEDDSIVMAIFNYDCFDRNLYISFDAIEKYVAYYMIEYVWDNISEDIYLYKDKENFPYKKIQLKNDSVITYLYNVEKQEWVPAILTENKNETIDSLKSESKNNNNISNPNLLKDLITIGGITLNSSMEDILLKYPRARISYSNECSEFSEVKNYIVDDLDNFNYVEYSFKDDNIVHVLKHKSGSKYQSYGIPSFVQCVYDEFNTSYGLPKVKERDYVYDGIHYYKRYYVWCGIDVRLTLDYEWETTEYGQLSYASCSVDYEF